MKKTLIPSLTLLLLCPSCKWILEKKYGVNKSFKFETKTAYIHYLEKHRSFAKDNIIYIDSSSFSNLYQLLTNPISVYYGSFINDSVMIKKSDYLMNNESCMGRMDGEIKKNLVRKQYLDSLLITTPILKNFKFLNAGNQIVKIEPKGRLKIFLLHFYGFGSVYDYIYKEVYKTYASTNKAFDLYIISLDPIYQLPD